MENDSLIPYTIDVSDSKLKPKDTLDNEINKIIDSQDTAISRVKNFKELTEKITNVHKLILSKYAISITSELEFKLIEVKFKLLNEVMNRVYEKNFSDELTDAELIGYLRESKQWAIDINEMKHHIIPETDRKLSEISENEKELMETLSIEERQTLINAITSMTEKPL